ncbi:MAG: zinc dependent phospholipase C family protein [Coriobacteriales bacterium]|nr:zinc dependent phospholipase C family protein [Coriobacteriales bacterium]
MPAIITHHLFGEDASQLLPNDLVSDQEDLLAFLLGNQGSDPFWSRVCPNVNTMVSCHRLATTMHATKVVDAFMSLRQAVLHLPKDDMSVGRAFVLGILAHYLLDRITHPLVYALQEDIINADPTLEDARGDIHAIIESDIDTWILWQMRQQTILANPASISLMSTKRIDRVAGALFSYMAQEVYDIEIGPAEFGHALENYRFVYRVIDPPSNRLAKVVWATERFARPYSRLQAMAHRVTINDECPSANLDHRPWRNLSTGELSRASFADLFHEALTAWPVFSQHFIEGDRERLSNMVDGVNYDGWPDDPTA